MEIKVGDQFFIYDMNNRVYEKDENGRSKGGPTFRGHFIPVTIVDETSKSWVTSYYKSIAPKKNPFSVLYTEEMVDSAVWVHYNGHKIAEALRFIKDVSVLKQVAEIIGYKE